MGFLGGSVVKISPSNAGGVGSILGLGAKIPHASWTKKTKTLKKKKRWDNVTNSIKTLKMVHIKKKKKEKEKKGRRNGEWEWKYLIPERSPCWVAADWLHPVQRS